MSKNLKTDEVEVSDNESLQEEEEVYNSDDNGSDMLSTDSEINIDLTNNDIYKALCTLFEDQDGNNILDYMNIIKDDVHELVKGVKCLVSIKKDITRIADSIEKYVNRNEQKNIDVKKKNKI